MAEERIAKPYAKSLFELANESGKLDVVHQDLSGLAELIESSRDLHDLLHNPVISEEAAAAVLNALFDSKVDELTSRFLQFINAKGRRRILSDIIVQFDILFMNARGRLKVHVISAREMSSDQLERIKDKLSKRHNKSIVLSTETDADLLGGFIIRIGDTVHNFSVRNQLENLRKNIINAS